MNLHSVPRSKPDDVHPYDHVVGILRNLGRLRGHGCRADDRRARARCPAHDDLRPSLSVTRDSSRVLIKCFAGCKTTRVLESMGLTMADLFQFRATNSGATIITETYDYIDLNGELIAQKVRYQPKRFSWRRPDPIAPSGWRYKLAGRDPGLYRLPDLQGCVRLLLNEGTWSRITATGRATESW